MEGKENENGKANETQMVFGDSSGICGSAPWLFNGPCPIQLPD
jgi:hypothetical protein